MSDFTDSVIKLIRNRINGVEDPLSDYHIPTQNERDFDNLMMNYNRNLSGAVASRNNESRQHKATDPIVNHMWNAFDPESKYDQPLGPTRWWDTQSSDRYDKAYSRFRKSFDEDEPLMGSQWINDKANIAQMQSLYDMLTTPYPNFNSK